MLSQMQELVARVQAALPEPWNKKVGRPKSCGLYRAIETARMYIRQNVTQEFLGDLRDISQSTVSRRIKDLTPVVEKEGGRTRPKYLRAEVQLLAVCQAPRWMVMWRHGRWAGSVGNS